MKKILIILVLIGTIFFPMDVQAASGTCAISGKTSVTVGSTVTVTVKLSASQMYMAKGTVTSNNTAVLSGSGSVYKKADLSNPSEEKGFSSVSQKITFTANAVGSATISFSADAGNCLDINDSPISFSGGSLTINVVAKQTTPSNNGGNSGGTTNNGGGTNTQTPTDTKSKDNTLSSLSVSNGTLSPEFKSNTTSYTVNLSSDITKVSITAKANDSKAKVTGIGEKSLKIGENKYRVVVVAENGSSKTYTINFIVDEKPTLFTELNGSKLGFVTNIKDVKAPNGFEKSTTTFDSQKVNCWVNEKTKLTIVYLEAEDESKDFYIIEDAIITRKYEAITILGKDYTILDIPTSIDEQLNLKKTTVKIGEKEVVGWKFEDEKMSNYSIVYLMNDIGESNLYSYEESEGTLQKYIPFESPQTNTLTYVFIGTTALFALTSIGIAISFMRFKKKSISAIKDYYDRKNQG